MFNCFAVYVDGKQIAVFKSESMASHYVRLVIAGETFPDDTDFKILGLYIPMAGF